MENDEKVVPFFQSNDEETEITPLELVENLKKIPEDIIADYIKVLKIEANESTLLINVFANINYSNTLLYLINDLEQKVLDRFNRIALHLGKDDPIEGMSDLVALSLRTHIDEESLAIADRLLDIVATCDETFCWKQIVNLLNLSHRYSLASKIFLHSNQPQKYREELAKEIAKLSKENVNKLFEFVNNIAHQ